jgi:thioredoxin 2
MSEHPGAAPHRHGAVLRGDGAAARTQTALHQTETQDESAPATRFNIRSIPTLIVFRADKELARQSGSMDASTLIGAR